MGINYKDEYRVSERVTLEPGDLFRATGGPYYLTRDEAGKRVKIPMAAKGPFRFIRLAEYRRRRWIEAYSTRDGGHVVLSLSARRSVMPGLIVARPYKITGKVGRTRRERKAVRL